MTNKIFLGILVIVSVFILAINFISAAPDIQILSPKNITYNVNKIPIEIKSNEQADLLIKSARGEFIPLAQNVINYQSSIYGKTGAYDFTVYANNSNGMTSKTVFYTIRASNPIDITTGGTLVSSNTEYVLRNNIAGALFLFDVENISLNLNNFEISSPSVAIIGSILYSRIENGTLRITSTSPSSTRPSAAISITFGNGVLWKNINIESVDAGVFTELEVSNQNFHNVKINAPKGVFTKDGVAELNFKDSSITSPGSALFIDRAFTHFSIGPDKITLQKTNVSNYTSDIFLRSFIVPPEYFLKDSKINISSISNEGGRLIGPARIFTQHLAIINVTDPRGGVPAAVRIAETSTGQISPENSAFTLDANPTSNVLIGTDETGIAKVFLTEKATIIRATSPLTTQEISYPEYNLSTDVGNVSATVLINLSALNSTIFIPISVPSAVIPACTLSQMLDLNNDNSVNIQDAVLVLRHIVGKSVSINSTKGCEGINLNPFE